MSSYLNVLLSSGHYSHQSPVYTTIILGTARLILARRPKKKRVYTVFFFLSLRATKILEGTQ